MCLLGPCSLFGFSVFGLHRGRFLFALTYSVFSLCPLLSFLFSFVISMSLVSCNLLFLAPLASLVLKFLFISLSEAVVSAVQVLG